MSTMNPNEALKVFAATIGSQPTGLAYHQPAPWAGVSRCFVNAGEKVRREGRGQVRYGWTFHDRIAEGWGAYLFATHHAVWQPPKAGSLT